MKKILITIILLGSFFFLKAQNVSKINQLLSEAKYQKVAKITKKAKNICFFYYASAKLYSADGYPKKDLPLAYSYANKGAMCFVRLNYKYRSMLAKKYQLKQRDISSLKDSIARVAFEQATQKGTIEAYYEFTSFYPNSNFIGLAQYRIDSIRLDNLYRDSSLKTIVTYLAQNNMQLPGGEYEKAYAILDKQWKTYFRALDMEMMQACMNYFPDYKFPDSAYVYMDIANKLLVFKPWRGYVDSLRPYYVKLLKEAGNIYAGYQLLTLLITPQVTAQQWQDAVDTVNKYRSFIKNQQLVDDLVRILTTGSEINSYPLPGKVNSSSRDELFPVFSLDMKTMYFMGRDPFVSYAGNEDVFVSHFDGKQWDEPKKIEVLSSQELNEAPLSVSPDGQTMFLFINGDIATSDFRNSHWTRPRPFRPLNMADSWQSDAFITADGSAIIFSSDRENPNGPHKKFNSYYYGSLRGNLDLWVIVKQEDGTWSDPINLGSTINTNLAERSAFLHPDMRTLYFSSEGHGGLGDMDLWVSYRLSDTSWTQWSKPVNLGRYINTPGAQYAYRVSTDGKSATFSKRESNATWDIYWIEMPQNIKPQKVIIVHGYVANQTGEPLRAKVVWEDLETGRKMGELYSSGHNGYYLIALPEGKNYGVYVTANGYYPVSDNVDLSNNIKKDSVRKDFVLYANDDILRGDVSVVLKNVFFDFNSDRLRPESYPELDRFANFVIENPDYTFEIAGHTDNIGSKQYNQKLSLKRAKAVEQYLLKKGCSPSQFKVAGYGATKPKADNSTEEGRALNRRVEFRVIK